VYTRRAEHLQAVPSFKVIYPRHQFIFFD